MAKRLNVKVIKDHDNKAIQSLDLDDEGKPQVEDGGKKLKTKDMTILDALDTLVRVFPRERMTMENITEGTRLKIQLAETRESKSSFLQIDDSTHKWALKMLKDDAVGPKTFGFDLMPVIDAMDDFQRAQEKKVNSES